MLTSHQRGANAAHHHHCGRRSRHHGHHHHHHLPHKIEDKTRTRTITRTTTTRTRTRTRRGQVGPTKPSKREGKTPGKGSRKETRQTKEKTAKKRKKRQQEEKKKKKTKKEEENILRTEAPMHHNLKDRFHISQGYAMEPKCFFCHGYHLANITGLRGQLLSVNSLGKSYHVGVSENRVPLFIIIFPIKIDINWGSRSPIFRHTHFPNHKQTRFGAQKLTDHHLWSGL
jgi:hypothetical protein